MMTIFTPAGSPSETDVKIRHGFCLAWRKLGSKIYVQTAASQSCQLLSAIVSVLEAGSALPWPLIVVV